MAFREKSNFAKDSRVAWAMMTAVDTNVIVALWDPDALLSGAANVALDEAVGRGRLVICGPVFAELMVTAVLYWMAAAVYEKTRTLAT